MGHVPSPPMGQTPVAGGGPQADRTATARLLAERHFVLQEERPDDLQAIDPVALDASLRSLLFTDGTVTRTLEVQVLAPVSVEVVGQLESAAVGRVAEHLDVADGTAAIQRRVAIGIDSYPAPAIWAESHIVPSRLPTGFLGVLDNSPDGIGESLQQVRLESWRELLWFGLDSAPDWGPPNPDAGCTVLRRLYRVISQDQPAILISESFAVEQGSGGWSLRPPRTPRQSA